MINDALRLLRVFHDYKSKELAEKLGISQSYLSEIEHGKKTPTLELLNKYGKIFNMKTSTLIFFSEELDVSTKKGQIKDNMRSFMIKFLRIIEKQGELNLE
ncbi:helix-turn-helix transcriptional regulator [Desulfosporosinus sp.]|uniref:helix-turn-helix domain-containing protein n=1 Tax=Desulfosporosinus sp. TaxID=157907 RepID=UPI00232235C1|nr:helix-turn-helix transcriptional regulator [Desulfosporosinus sp.]MDA8223587.1 helix-turn-helix transcriptional regulator [Desulfitobacterium hafniense]